MTGYAIRRTPEPFDGLDRWEVVELNCWQYARDRHRRVTGHATRRGALRSLRRLEENQAHSATATSESIPLVDLRAQ